MKTGKRKWKIKTRGKMKKKLDAQPDKLEETDENLEINLR